MHPTPVISEHYRKLNAALHAERKNFGGGGKAWAGQVLALCEAFDTRDVLDYGCGKSSLAAALAFPIRQYDPAIPEFSAAPEPADIVACTDVLEHIEPECLDNVLDDLARLVKIAGFFVIAHAPAAKTLPDGRNAHLIVQPPRWWLDKMWDRFTVAGFSSRGSETLLSVMPPGSVP